MSTAIDMNPAIAILIPCYNKQTIYKVVTDFHKSLPDAEVYVYDNNSTDETASLAKSPGAFVRTETRQGKGNVIRSMFNDIDADVCIYIMVSRDDTYPAKVVPKMVSKMFGGYDVVIGHRSSVIGSVQPTSLRTSDLSIICNKLVRASINGLFHAKIADIITVYRAFSFTYVKTYPILSTGFEIETEMTIHSLDKRLRLCGMHFQYRDRPQVQ